MDEALLAQFSETFAVPAVAVPYLSRIVTEQEMRLVVAAAGKPLKAAQAAAVLAVSLEEARAALDGAWRRGVLDRATGEEGDAYSPTDFAARLDAFVTYEGWGDVPRSVRRELDEWALAKFVEEMRPGVERLRAGALPEGRRVNDSVMLARELDQIIDAARTIVVVPCDCRRTAEQCDRPVETCLHFDADAERLLARGRGRRLTAAEAKALVRWADRKGLMHTTNHDPDWQPCARDLSPICNCCADDCYVFRAAVRLGSKGVWPRSRYRAAWDRAACNLCGICVKRCHFGAFSYGEPTVEVKGKLKREVLYDAARCWGCGLCANACPQRAVTMEPLALR